MWGQLTGTSPILVQPTVAVLLLYREVYGAAMVHSTQWETIATFGPLLLMAIRSHGEDTFTILVQMCIDTVPIRWMAFLFDA